MIADRRLQTRDRLHQPARLVFNGEQSVLACTVRNHSQTGAMIRMADWIELPDTFELDIPAGDRRRVRQCWRRGDDVGVAFLTLEEATPSPVVSLAEARARRAGVRDAD
ncbi:MAG: PilZ domain-containing protein [Bosea sp. (in: a-proteobacteria)]|uniref:PilZ domain-containing protein n=1 Tax=Bosea sp. (in: a-proteobacteria) TaxID=1871050 RepID=UPI00273692E6|nr:PilZ domain-containing protein [Bosea sp. (in: a-proteobacteria)]MDP3258181.1 PilZ domain-containing protein [Bosea sp. (in: a-proteobacteria)]MDP3319342.1 PilZ domain-containing protein [Bosea sp. (in: a-proteobacteria)]